MFDKVRGDLGLEFEDSAPLVSNSRPINAATTANTAAATTEKAPSARMSTSADRDAIHITVVENISASLTREGSLQSFSVKGDLQIYISDAALSKLKLNMVANPTHNAQFKTHPQVDKSQFTSSKRIQMKDQGKGFPVNASLGILRWNATTPADTPDVAPITFTVWVNKASDASYNLTIEYEKSRPEPLNDVVVTIPYSTSEPAVSSFDAVYEVSGDTLEWTIGTIDESNSSGAFEFEAQAEEEAEFFPMKVHFSKSKPFVDVDVSQDSSALWKIRC